MQDAENSWAFDIFGFADATPGYSLSLLFCHLVQRSGLCKELLVDEGRAEQVCATNREGLQCCQPLSQQCPRGISGANDTHADVLWGCDEDPGPESTPADGHLLLGPGARL